MTVQQSQENESRDSERRRKPHQKETTDEANGFMWSKSKRSIEEKIGMTVCIAGG